MKDSITQIIATIGPTSSKKGVLYDMISHKMDMARLNFSWGDYAWHLEIINNIREISKNNNIYIPIIQDLSGPRVQEGTNHRFGGNDDDDIITEKDIKDLSFGIKNNVDYIALSFVGSANDIIQLKKLIHDRGGKQKVISKIERKIAYQNIDEIIEVSDAIMVARGDLGNEFPLEEIPFIQHHIIKKCNTAGKMVIVATQMLLSMVDSPIPTRAEVSDVAYAILDGADGVMLSEESAKGNFPIEAISMMEKIALYAENFKNKVKIG
jgi:pyruvate kinase